MKPQNLLVTQNSIVKIADFGLARGFDLPIKNYTDDVVSLYYRPPDVLLGSINYFTSIDIWSIGCIFTEMSNGTVFIKGDDETDQLAKIFQIRGTPNETTYPELINLPKWSLDFENNKAQDLSKLCPKIDENGIDLLGKMLRVKPDTRISAQEALLHPFFADLPQHIKDLYN